MKNAIMESGRSPLRTVAHEPHPARPLSRDLSTGARKSVGKPLGHISALLKDQATTTPPSTRFAHCRSKLAAKARSSIATPASMFRVCPRSVKFADVISV